MKTAGIICEYNPFHLGHFHHIEMTKKALGDDISIACVMSGNYVQRGDFAIFNKHARAKMAVLCGADLVIELPSPFALGSAREFAKAGVYLLDALGVCGCVSFGSESGDIDVLQDAARAIVSEKAEEHIREQLGLGLPYATAQQKAAYAVLGEKAGVFSSPNNTLGIEYIKAINEYESDMEPLTVKRIGARHDSSTGCSASNVRRLVAKGKIPFEHMMGASAAVCMEESALGRGPVLMRNMEQAVLSRLRNIRDCSNIPGATDGLAERFSKAAISAPSVLGVLEQAKTKRFAMSRIRRLMMCAVLGITNKHVKKPPPYIRVLAMNERGKMVLKEAGDKAKLPIVTKPASVRDMGKRAVRLFELESSATDFYTLAYRDLESRAGGSEWRTSPVVV